MAFNFFKKKKKEEAKQKAAGDEKVASPAMHKAGEKEPAAPQKKRKGKFFASNVLLSAHITEKATMLQAQGQYVFRVHSQATKGAVKQSVQALYGVSVLSVSLIKKPSKKIRVGKRDGIKQGFKKAVIRLKKGEKIEIISR